MYRVPDRWLDYSRCGKVIGYTEQILATKTPLKKDYHRCKERPEGVPPSEQFTPTQLVKYCIKNEQRIGLVVDLTNKDNKYYDPKEFKSFGIKYAKIHCPGKVIPQHIYPQFAEVLEDHFASIFSGMVVVHCTRGVNRTGYLICRFLMQHFKYSANHAIEAFNNARGHGMDREDYIANIHAYWRHSQKLPSTIKAPNTASSLPPAKSRQSKPSTAYGNSSSHPHGALDQYDNDYQNDDDNDKDDDEYSNPRSKGKNRQTQNEWDDEWHKDKRRNGKNHTPDDQYEIDYDDYPINDDEDDGDDDDGDDDDDDHDDHEYSNPRYKGRNRQYHNAWDNKYHKDTRRGGKSHTYAELLGL